MFAVFDVIRRVGIGMVPSETKILKLVRGGELLVSTLSRICQVVSLTATIQEQVEIPTLQAQVRVDEERALSQPISDNLLHVLVIVKRPLLALRYTLPDGQIRKTQMNFVPNTGCDVALENFRAAGLPIRDKDLPQVQSKRPQSSQSQPLSQELPGCTSADQATLPRSSQGVFPRSAQPLAQGATIGWRTSPGSIAFSAQPTKTDIRPTSTPGGMDQDGPSRPISLSSRSTLNAFGAPITITSVPTVAKLKTQSNLLPSPVFDGTYQPMKGFEIRPMSAPEQTQTQQEDINTPSLSQMLPPERTRTFAEKTTYQSAIDELTRGNALTTKTKAKRQSNTRIQPAKPRKSRAKDDTTTTPSDSLAPSSPSPASRVRVKAAASRGSARVASPELQETTLLSKPLALSNPSSLKRSMTDQSVHQPNKRQAQLGAEENVTEDLTRTAAAEGSPAAQPSEATDPLANIASHDLLDSIDNLMRKYHDLPVPTSSRRISKDELAEYAAQSEDESAKAIDNLICECIKDENFAKLMDDVEGAWKRIGLGL